MGPAHCWRALTSVQSTIQARRQLLRPRHCPALRASWRTANAACPSTSSARESAVHTSRLARAVLQRFGRRGRSAYPRVIIPPSSALISLTSAVDAMRHSERLGSVADSAATWTPRAARPTTRAVSDRKSFRPPHHLLALHRHRRRLPAAARRSWNGLERNAFSGTSLIPRSADDTLKSVRNVRRGCVALGPHASPSEHTPLRAA